MKAGDISQPLPYTDDRGTKAVRLVYLKTRTEPHRENLKDDYNKVAERALNSKKIQALQDWFNTHISSFYVNIDKEYLGCQNMEQWTKLSQASAK